MKIIITILLVLAGIIAVLLIIALFLKKEHYVNREIIINAPRQKVFDFLRFLENQDKFNKWAKTDPDRKTETKGTDGTVGYIYSWSGNKDAGQGVKEIKTIIEGKRIETEIRFTKPMNVTASMIIETEALSDNQTKVNFINTGTLKYPLNLMIPIAERNFAKDLDSSLATLKNILENDNEQ
jgi:uncharacterized protein YndB with AHSA1/START domain